MWNYRDDLPIPAWALMGLICLAIYVGFKTAAWRMRARRPVAPARAVGFWLAWPGMDATRFCDARTAVESPPIREWTWAASKTAFGAALLWFGVRLVPLAWELSRGWVGMIGLAFVFHFGALHLISLAWRAGGVDARPIMNAPHRSQSLSEFWGRRWNLAFRDVANPLVFRPTAKRYGTAAAMWATFAFSGVVHELGISVPAAGGFGLPTAYFLLQAAGVALQRSSACRRLGLDRGLLGWLFTLIFTALPALFLFHPPFVGRVMLPFLAAIGAT